MSFDYEVFATEEEAMKAKEFPLLDDGVYRFRVIESKPRQSSSGNSMIALKICIEHEGQEYNVFDNLIGVKSMAWKVKHFAEATGLEREYAIRAFNCESPMDREGYCLIGNEPAKPKNDGSKNHDGSPAMYKAKNIVEDYIPAKANNTANPFAPAEPLKKAPIPVSPPAEEFDTDLPF